MDIDEVIVLAREQIEKPYKWGASGPDEFDCTGLVKFCYNLPTYYPWAQELYLGDCVHIPATHLEAGNLVFRYAWNELYGTKMIDHVGIFTGGVIIHASRVEGKVVESPLDEKWNLFGVLIVPHIVEPPVDLRLDFLTEFTSRADFKDRVKVLLENQLAVILWEIKRYADTTTFAGMPTWAVHCKRKADRLYNRVLRDSFGRDSCQHDLDDLLRYAVYTNLYYRILRESKKPELLEGETV